MLTSAPREISRQMLGRFHSADDRHTSGGGKEGQAAGQDALAAMLQRLLCRLPGVRP